VAWALDRNEPNLVGVGTASGKVRLSDVCSRTSRLELDHFSPTPALNQYLYHFDHAINKTTPHSYRCFVS
jgi:hypothetical protein